ncbi:unnamed protein product [Didymodactylos carnosus]|uniref:Uncharacterized protein n=1 Tax=Didymodactylos carnosus TaxID=1234261 RepID=A0A814FRX6_9BILA|nr:unnamed protein product [Didymodactylos carnosus]CAF1162414.1 unnamed protein product [Didymodactylos carnosus]CAF3758734.1 unnamed protein product [Didymodactylos carnosus]CAF3974070.1 unnamed protein product [Didymodactylos carnosus]
MQLNSSNVTETELDVQYSEYGRYYVGHVRADNKQRHGSGAIYFGNGVKIQVEYENNYKIGQSYLITNTGLKIKCDFDTEQLLNSYRFTLDLILLNGSRSQYDVYGNIQIKDIIKIISFNDSSKCFKLLDGISNIALISARDGSDTNHILVEEFYEKLPFLFSVANICPEQIKTKQGLWLEIGTSIVNNWLHRTDIKGIIIIYETYDFYQTNGFDELELVEDEIDTYRIIPNRNPDIYNFLNVVLDGNTINIPIIVITKIINKHFDKSMIVVFTDILKAIQLVINSIFDNESRCSPLIMSEKNIYDTKSKTLTKVVKSKPGFAILAKYDDEQPPNLSEIRCLNSSWTYVEICNESHILRPNDTCYPVYYPSEVQRAFYMSLVNRTN